MDEKAAIQSKLTEWGQDTADWATAYHRAAQSALAWNGRLVVVGIVGAAILTAIGGSTTGISGSTSAPIVTVLGVVAAFFGVITAAANGLQKTNLASPEQAKQYHNAAVNYGAVVRDIDGVLTTDPTDTGVTVDELRNQRDAIKTQLKTVDAQAPELPRRFRKLATSPSSAADRQ